MTALGLSDGPEDRSGRPPVHYQISVTGKQAGFFFLLLLAALALAFFFGMRTGAAARKGPGAAATLASASDIPVPTLAPSDGPRETRRTDASAEHPADEPLGFAPDKRAALKEAATQAATMPVPTAAMTSQPPAPVPSPTAAPHKTAPVRGTREAKEAKETKEAKGTPAPKAAAKSSAPFYVQILATKKAPAADELMKRLKTEGFAADVSPVPGKDGWFRVRVGPFKDRTKAEAAAKKIKTTDKQIRNTPLVVP